jgi:hypothetical protein
MQGEKLFYVTGVCLDDSALLTDCYARRAYACLDDLLKALYGELFSDVSILL